MLKPVSCGREGQAALIQTAHPRGRQKQNQPTTWPKPIKEALRGGDMAVLCADTKTRDLCARHLAQRKLPVENRLGSGDFDPTSNKIKVMTMKVSKGLEFPVVAPPGVGHMPAAGRMRRKRLAGVLCAATRATQKA